MNQNRYRLVKDDDNHWFVIPSHKRLQWENWLDGLKFDGKDYIVPEWVKAINGSPSLVTFENVEIE